MVNRKVMMLAMVLCMPVVGLAQPGMGRGNAVNIDGIKTKLDATDEEWKVISPLIQKIIAARQAIAVAKSGGTPVAGRMGPGGMGNGSYSGPGDTAAGNMGGGGFGPGGGGATAVVVTPATVPALTPEEAAAVAAEDAKIKELVTTRAIKKANAEIEAVQKELKQLLTDEQETVLMKAGYLAN